MSKDWERTCPVCNKKFIPAPYHIYKTARGRKLVCTYTCMLKSERQHEQKARKNNES